MKVIYDLRSEFPIEAIGIKKPEKKIRASLRRSYITFIYIRSSYMDHFIYITSFHSFHGKI